MIEKPTAGLIPPNVGNMQQKASRHNSFEETYSTQMDSREEFQTVASKKKKNKRQPKIDSRTCDPFRTVGNYNESGLPSHALIHLISNSYQQPTYWAPPSFYPNLETYAPTYLCTLSHDGIIIMPGYHRVGFPGKSCYGTAQNQEILHLKTTQQLQYHKTTIINSFERQNK